MQISVDLSDTKVGDELIVYFGTICGVENKL